MTLSVTSRLEELINPLSGKSFADEKRIVEVKQAGDELFITYDRSGIDPQSKKVLESQMLELFSGEYAVDNICLKTVSKKSEDVYSAAENSPNVSSKATVPNAALKQGHMDKPVKKKLENVKNIVAVSSGKGGVGKSTLTVNLAMTLKNQGLKVGIIDADVYGPSIPMLMGKREEKPKSSSTKKIMPIESFGVKFVSFGLFVAEDEPVIWRGPMLGGVLNQFLFDVDWGDLDYLLIDLPPGTGDMQLSMVQSIDIDGAVIVSTPQSVALLDSKKGLQMFNKVEVPVLGMVENMSYFSPDGKDEKYFIFGQGGVATAAVELKVDLLGAIPLEIELREASDIGHPYMANNQYEGRAVWNAYNEFAKNITEKMTTKKPKSFLKKFFS